MSGKYKSGRERTPHLGWIHAPSFVLECRGTGNNTKILQPRQIIDNRFRNSVAQVLHLRLQSIVLKWKDCYGIGKLRGQRRLIVIGSVNWNCWNQETVTAFGNGLDEGRFSGIVAERFSQFGDAADEYVVGDECALPDLLYDLLFRNHIAGALKQAQQHSHHFGFKTDGSQVASNTVELGLHAPSAELKVGQHTPHPANLTLHYMRASIKAVSETLGISSGRWSGRA